jgi:mannose-1-phosphate guanylyltransferase
MNASTPRRALLLAGGLGTRLRPITDTTPKCLVKVRGKPLLGYWLDTLFNAGLERVLVNTHYLPDQVRTFCAEGPWAEKIELFHEDLLMGTAGTLRASATFFRGHGPFLLAHADNLTIFQPTTFFEAHRNRPSGCIGTMMTFTTDNPQECGIVEVDEHNIARLIHEKVAKPPGNLANAAVFMLEEEVLDWVENHSSASDFCRDVVPPLANRWFTFFNGEFHRDIGNPTALARAETDPYWTSK